MEGSDSGLFHTLGKRAPKGIVGSNPTPSAKMSGEMEKGYTMVGGARKVVRWIKGEPGFLTNVSALPKIVSYSCLKCGFLENFVESE